MADIVAANVTYDVQSRGVTKSGVRNIVKLTFGDGALTYERDTGIPLTKGKLGCPVRISKLKVLEGAVTSGYVWDWDQSAEALVGSFQDCDAVADSGLIELTDDLAIAAQEVWVEVEGY